ncbi:MAG: ABC transporter ATP-binding protein [Betaproteobacteria bacterium]
MSGTGSEPMIEFAGVGKSYALALHRGGGIKNLILNPPRALRNMRSENRVVLEDFSLRIAHGESIAVMGRNGAGKSTLLSLIAGVIRPSSGALAVNGRVSPLLELGAGFHPDLTGRDNVMLNGVLLGMRRAQVAARMERIVEFAELEEAIDEPVRTFSTGMVARLGFSVAAHLDPEILLIDEVLAVGDTAFQAKCIAKIHEFRNRGVTIVFVSHELKHIRELCDRAVVVADRRAAFVGDIPPAIAFYDGVRQGAS